MERKRDARAAWLLAAATATAAAPAVAAEGDEGRVGRNGVERHIAQAQAVTAALFQELPEFIPQEFLLRLVFRDQPAPASSTR